RVLAVGEPVAVVVDAVVADLRGAAVVGGADALVRAALAQAPGLRAVGGADGAVAVVVLPVAPLWRGRDRPLADAAPLPRAASLLAGLAGADAQRRVGEPQRI